MNLFSEFTTLLLAYVFRDIYQITHSYSRDLANSAASNVGIT
jgi:hypothetical protein